MAKYINVKLNVELFEKILNDIKEMTGDYNASHAEVVGKCLYGFHRAHNKRMKNGRTAGEVISESEQESREKRILDFEREFSKFIQNGKLSYLDEEQSKERL